MSLPMDEVRAIVGPDNVTAAEPDLLAYSRDSWPRAALWERRGHRPYRPDGVAWPRGVDDVAALVRLANARRFPVVPWGGGSGVCGAAIPVAGGLVLDMKRMDRVLSVDQVSRTVTAEAGILGTLLEDRLRAGGLTLGHFPASIHCATLGGFLATRSAGQLSTRYGKIEDMVIGLTAVLPTGEVLRTRAVPRRATGPDLAQVILGSEGTLGVICEAQLGVWAVPEVTCRAAFAFKGFEAGATAVRKIVQAGLRPAAVRLYDEADALLAGSGHGNALAPIAQGLLLSWPALANRLVALASGQALLVLTFEGAAGPVEAEAALAKKIAMDAGGEDIGPAPAERWEAHRYHVNFKMPDLLADGFLVDTIEVAATWDRAGPLYEAMREALRPHAVVLAHLSHAYPEGCAIYFSFAARPSTRPFRPEAAEALHALVWDRAMEATLASGGTIAHHHGIGLARAPFLARELGAGHGMLAALKRAMDPNGVMNPGKLGLP